MGIAFLYGNGGSGGGGLNFSVKEYAPETVLPSTGKENTIIVITDVKIASWIFSVTEPIAPAEGIVWIPTGTSSAVVFNALKKNCVEVYPTSVKQYIGGEWVDMDAYIYQNGEWVQFSEIFTSLYLYKAGDTCDSVTGGWGGSLGDGYLSFGGDSTGTQANTKNKISFEGYTKLMIEYEITSNHGSGNGNIRFSVSDRIETTYRHDYALVNHRTETFVAGNRYIAEITVSSVPESAYVIASGWYGSGKIYNVWLVP